MKSKTAHSLIVCLILTVSYLTPVQAVTDAELEALEKQLEQQEAEEKQKADAEAKRKVEEKRKSEAEAKKKRQAGLEKQRQEEQKLLEEERGKLEQEKRKLEEALQAELDHKQQEEEAKQFALEEKKRKEEEADKARVTVVIVRLSRYVGSLFAVPMKYNDTNIGSLPNGSFHILTSPPGSQSFATDTGYSSYDINKSFDFEPGQIYYIQLGVGFSYKLQLMPQTEGRNAIKGLKNVGKINPADVFSDYDESEAYKEQDTSSQQVPL